MKRHVEIALGQRLLKTDERAKKGGGGVDCMTFKKKWAGMGVIKQCCGGIKEKEILSWRGSKVGTTPEMGDGKGGGENSRANGPSRENARQRGSDVNDRRNQSPRRLPGITSGRGDNQIGR